MNEQKKIGRKRETPISWSSSVTDFSDDVFRQISFRHRWLMRTKWFLLDDVPGELSVGGDRRRRRLTSSSGWWNSPGSDMERLFAKRDTIQRQIRAISFTSNKFIEFRRFHGIL